VGRSLLVSSVAEPPGPESVTLARASAQLGSAGRANANGDDPSPSAVSGISNRMANSSPPSGACTHVFGNERFERLA